MCLAEGHEDVECVCHFFVRTEQLKFNLKLNSQVQVGGNHGWDHFRCSPVWVMLVILLENKFYTNPAPPPQASLGNPRLVC